MKNDPEACKRCLLYELDQSEQYRNLYLYLERIPAEDKIEKDQYHSRLSVCKSCDYLFQGMCRLCGCYVELRAAMRKNRCPGSPPGW